MEEAEAFVNIFNALPEGCQMEVLKQRDKLLHDESLVITATLFEDIVPLVRHTIYKQRVGASYEPVLVWERKTPDTLTSHKFHWRMRGDIVEEVCNDLAEQRTDEFSQQWIDVRIGKRKVVIDGAKDEDPLFSTSYEPGEMDKRTRRDFKAELTKYLSFADCHKL